MGNEEIGELVTLNAAVASYGGCGDDPNCDCADPGTGSDNCGCEDS